MSPVHRGDQDGVPWARLRIRRRMRRPLPWRAIASRGARHRTAHHDCDCGICRRRATHCVALYGGAPSRLAARGTERPTTIAIGYLSQTGDAMRRPLRWRITYLRTNGTTVVKNYTVPATSRFNVQVNAAVPELADESFSAVVEVLNGVAIAVERALYNNANGVVWAGGTNATAAKIP